jgi:hypothetical protein
MLSKVSVTTERRRHTNWISVSTIRFESVKVKNCGIISRKPARKFERAFSVDISATNRDPSLKRVITDPLVSFLNLTRMM